MDDATKPGGVVSHLARLASGGLPTIDWTLAHYTGEWPTNGAQISCPLPDHDDSTPSFNLWAEDDEGVPQRFGCFGCGAKGDVLELISIMENLSAEAALDRAAQLRLEESADSTPRPETKAPPAPADLDDVYRTATSAQTPGLFSHYMRTKGMGGEAVERYAMDEWGWVASAGRIFVPHRDANSDLVGIKYRALGRKWSEPGSRYTALYGTWRMKGHERVVVCEGESDTLWAAWSLRGQAVDVVGLPSGAQQALDADWLEMLDGRELTLMFDSDVAGMVAARQWYRAREDVRLARLPEDEDVLSCGIPVTELLDRAETPIRQIGGIALAGGVFCGFRKVGRGDDAEMQPYPLGDFSFRPVRELQTDDGPAWEGFLSGSQELNLIRGSDFTGSTFPKWANRHGRAWLGSVKDIQLVHNWLKSESAFLPLERAVSKAGKAERSYVGPGFCIGPDRLRYIPPTNGDAKLENKLTIEEGYWDRASILALEAMNDPGVMATILGWLTATLIRGKRAPAPPLFIAGESGAGKTHLIETVLEAFGFGIGLTLTTTTPFGVDCNISSTVGFPVWFDEYRAGAREDSLGRLRQMLRDAYNGQASAKGGMTAQATELTNIETWAGIVVSGEMGTHETSLRDRMVIIDLDPNQKNRTPYEWLRMPGKTGGLGYAFLEFLTKRPDTLFVQHPVGATQLPDRFRDTMGFVQAGWDAWLEFRLANGFTDTPTGPNFDAIAFGREESQDPWLEAMRACIGVMTRDRSCEIVKPVEGGYQVIPNEVILEASRVGIELPARAQEMVAWLKRRYEVVDGRDFNRRVKLVKGLEL